MRNPVDVENRRMSILTAAEKVFDARGYAEATMEEVAEQAGISKGNIYNYFQDKHHLFGQVFTMSLATHKAEMERIATEPGSATEKLQRFLDLWFQRLCYYKRVGRLILEFWATAAREEREGDLAVRLRELYFADRSHVASIIARGIQTGEFGRSFTPDVGASLILAVVDGITVHSLLNVGIDVNAEFLASLKRAVMSNLAGTAQTPGVRPAEGAADGATVGE